MNVRSVGLLKGTPCAVVFERLASFSFCTHLECLQIGMLRKNGMLVRGKRPEAGNELDSISNTTIRLLTTTPHSLRSNEVHANKKVPGKSFLIHCMPLQLSCSSNSTYCKKTAVCIVTHPLQVPGSLAALKNFVSHEIPSSAWQHVIDWNDYDDSRFMFWKTSDRVRTPSA